MFWRVVTRPLLKCVDKDHTLYVLNEVLRGICGIQVGGWSMTPRVICVGYYWPTLRTDAKYVKTCKECQEFSNVLHTPLEALHSITSPWPFAMCGMDILEPFPMAKG